MKGQSATYALAGIIVLVFLFFVETTPFVRINRNFVTIEFDNFAGLANFSIIPIQYSDLTLGNSTNFWQDLYLSNMIYLNGFWISANGTTNIPPPLNFTANYINHLNNNTLHVAGWGTGDPLNNENDLFVGDGRYGSIAIGSDAQIARLDGVGQIGSMNASHVFLFRHDETPIVNNISFLFTSANKIRFAIPVAGAGLATYNPRSQMIGGDLGQTNDNNVVVCSAQGYDYIDCITDVTGADLGVQDDLEVRGNFYGNLIYGEAWNYTSYGKEWTFDIASAGVYYNFTGMNNVGLLNGVTYTNVTEAMGGSYFTMQFDGIYKVSMSVTAEGVLADDTFGFGVAKNFDIDTSRNCYSRRWIRATNAGNIAAICLLNLTVGDTVNIQIENEDGARDLKIHSANLNLIRVGN